MALKTCEMEHVRCDCLENEGANQDTTNHCVFIETRFRRELAPTGRFSTTCCRCTAAWGRVREWSSGKMPQGFKTNTCHQVLSQGGS
eukprot:3839703-Rhodomonas_salina.1